MRGWGKGLVVGYGEGQEAEDPEKANPFAEQEKWEAEQMRRTHMKVSVQGGGWLFVTG